MFPVQMEFNGWLWPVYVIIPLRVSNKESFFNITNMGAVKHMYIYECENPRTSINQFGITCQSSWTLWHALNSSIYIYIYIYNVYLTYFVI